MNVAGGNVPNYDVLIFRLAQSGQWDRVLETAREYLSQDTENPRAHLAAGQALLNLKRYAEAEPHLGRVIEKEPGNSAAHRFMSLVTFQLQRFKEADEAAERALSLSPTDCRNWYHLSWMFYLHDDKASAATCARRAVELNPMDSASVNMLALCTPKNSASAAEKLSQYEQALELDPENADIHTNIGTYHLTVTRDMALAEKCYRRALFFDPASDRARNSLLVVLKHRDALYRALRKPRDELLQFLSLERQPWRKLPLLLFVLMGGIAAVRVLLAVVLVWSLYAWPTLKVYEFLTIADIQAGAGEVGARRGGFLGHRKWPALVRLAIFCIFLLLCWASLAWVLFWATNPDIRNDVALCMFALFATPFLLYSLFAKWRKTSKQKRLKSYSRQRAERMAALLQADTVAK